MLKIEIKRYIIYFVGLFMLTLGQRLFVYAGFGAGAFDAFCVGISQKIGLSAGTWVSIVSVVMLLLASAMQKKIPTIGIVITSVVFSVFFDFWGILLPQIFSNNLSFYSKIFLYVFGLMSATIGTTIYFKAKMPKSAYDEMIIANSMFFKMPIWMAKSTLEISMLMLAIFIGGPIGVTTVTTALLFGPLLKMWGALFDRK